MSDHKTEGRCYNYLKVLPGGIRLCSWVVGMEGMLALWGQLGILDGCNGHKRHILFCLYAPLPVLHHNVMHLQTIKA